MRYHVKTEGGGSAFPMHPEGVAAELRQQVASNRSGLVEIRLPNGRWALIGRFNPKYGFVAIF
jgi:hypothetical protein